MSIPNCFDSKETYINEILAFLKSNQWLYNYPNTDILIEKVFDSFPKEWISFLSQININQFKQLLLNKEELEDTPETLKLFLEQLNRFKPKYEVYLNKTEYKFKHNNGLGKKKLHEITSLAPLVHKICSENNVQNIFDIGAGLGYLSHILHDQYNYQVIGIEGDEEKYKLALKNANNLSFIHHFITDQSTTFLDQLIKDNNLENNNSAIIGLHACADLSITILEIFVSLKSVKCLIIMPCCYHRIALELREGKSETFKHFPVSKTIKELFAKWKADEFICTPFLRLACQQSMGNFLGMSEEEHEEHAFACMTRAVLQEAAHEVNCTVKRIKRKSAKRNQDFASYLANLKTTHKLVVKNNHPSSSSSSEGSDQVSQHLLLPPKIDDEDFVKNVQRKWQQHKANCYLVEVLTGLQASLQRVCENLVLLDRVEYLREKGIECCRLEMVTDDRISPRCFALVAVKSQSS